MTDFAALSPLALCLVTAAVAGGGSLLPVSPTEPLLVAVAAVAPSWLLLPLTIIATVSSMLAKVVIYHGGRVATRAIPEKHRDKVEKTREQLTGRPWLRGMVLVASAAAGIPPFYLVTVLCGSLGVPLRDFLIAGMIGRAVRFGTLLYVPHFIARSM